MRNALLQAGTYLESAKGTACTPCSPGQYQVAGGQTKCNPCPANEFSSEAGAYACKNCEAEEGEGFGAAPGSSSCDVCQPDYWYVRVAYTQLYLVSILMAPFHLHLPSLRYQTSSGTCKTCGLGTKFEGYACSQGGTTTETTPMLSGYWRVNKNSDSLLTCRRSEFCLGDSCRDGHEGAYWYVLS